ncbi:FAD-dependent oxidoreductase [Streptomyces sp. RB6PN25]|uniref:FAD-dependent oxidoreductase n=1 Tax=Streptomyces humicola TaxID=2953240 RepID=A0ABT1PVB9_9ACTN|nr:NAD(P)/FAD-dependent oxidoreductase [Streptomyces humicola]MCQ4081617.1 FAD-dependent oxidoreductase [Streptomyces humicola]
MPFHAPHSDTDVIVVGAGLAGLSTAHHLVNAGVTVTVLEAAPRVGGRMSTESVDGFRLDRGSQLLGTAYPELRRTPGLKGLRLLPLTPVTAPAAHPRGALGAFHKARLGSALGRFAAIPLPRLLARAETTAAEALAARGFPPRMVDGYLRPLLIALLHDAQLTTSSRCADLVLRGFARGRLALPAGGSGAVPELLAAALPPGTVRLGARAISVSANAVTTADGERMPCRAAVVATGARDAAALLPGLRVPSFHPVTVVHHAADAAEAPRLREPALVLGSDGRGPVAHTMVASDVDRSRAPAGRVLITSTVLGPATAAPPELLDRSVRAHLAELYGTRTDGWQLLAVRDDPRAVPAMPAPHDLRRPVRVLCGLYVCGDHRDTSTVQGALFSGRRAAHHVMRDFGIRPGYGDTARDLPAAA